MPSPVNTLRSFVLSLCLHVLAAALLVLSFDFSARRLMQPQQPATIINTVTVDAQEIDREMERLAAVEKEKQDTARRREEELQKKLADLQNQTRATERRRVEEEKRLAEVEKKKEQETKQREVEQKKLEEVRRQAEELEKKKRAEEERLKKEAEAKKRAEEERKQKEAEETLKKMLAEEQKAREAARLAAQEKADLSIMAQYTARITAAIQQRYNITGLDTGLSAVLTIRMVPGGEVVSVRVDKSSGNEVFDRRAEAAVYAASPLPVPDEARLFERMREIRLTFCPTCTR